MLGRPLLRLHPRHAPAQVPPSGPATDRPGRAAAVRREVPAGDRAGHGQGVEDTAFYVYNRLVSLNEVGGDPGRFGVAPAEPAPRSSRTRPAQLAGALSPLSTHDTKRSEDVRARLNVLSELPDEWQ